MASGSIKRQRRRKRTDEDGDPEFQVAPMIDVLLVLTLFFMSITSTELLKKDKNLQLPDAKNGKKQTNKPQPGKITINVTWDYHKNTAGFNIDGRSYPDAKSLGGYLSRQVQEEPRSYVLIRADRDVQFSNISDVMAACGSSGISTVSFAVITGGNKNKNAGSHPGAAATP
jgi:biopolymer transport protein ExbD